MTLLREEYAYGAVTLLASIVRRQLPAVRILLQNEYLLHRDAPQDRVKLSGRIRKVALVIRWLERQGHEQFVAFLERHFGDQAVGAFRERGQDSQGCRGIMPAQLREELPNVLAMLRQVGGAQVPMAGYTDDDGQPAVRDG